MRRHDEAQQDAGWKGASLDPPPLVLDVPGLEGPSPRELRHGDALYALAAWVLHHGDTLPPAERRGLYVALVQAWPTRGAPSASGHRDALMLGMVQNGASIASVARTFHVERDTATGAVKRAAHGVESDGLPSVRVSSDDPDHLPEDPAGGIAYMRSLCASPSGAQRQLTDVRRRDDAAACDLR